MNKVKASCINISIKAGKIENAVFVALLANIESGNLVYIPNVQSTMQEYGINQHQVAGFLSSLEKRGKYKPTSDKYFGQVTI